MGVVDTFYKGLTGNSDEKVSQQEREDRMKLCMRCPLLIKPTNNCAKCGCFVTLKTQYKAEQCPIDKW